MSPELLALWCTEVLGCFVFAYLLLSTGQRGGSHDGLLSLQAAHQALVMALTTGVVSFGVGLYSADLCAATGRLLAGTAIGGCVALPALLLAGHAVGIDFAAVAEVPVVRLPVAWLPRGWVSAGGSVSGWPVVGLALVAWALTGVAIKLAFCRARLFVRHVLIIADGPGDAGAMRLVAALRTAGAHFAVLAVLPVDRATDLVPPLLRARNAWQRKVWAVVMTDAACRRLAPGPAANLWRCRVHDAGTFWETCLRRIDIVHPSAAPREVASAPPHCLDVALTRGTDIVLGLALLLLILPLMLLTALLIKADSPGPVLYRQQRVGLHGRLFAMFKFRSMRVDAETRGPVWAAADDPRATRVGAVIRLIRVDELPQLVNVLRGDMSLIGPRPERPYFVERLAATMPLYCERARVKPGLTGWAQVNYPYGASVEDACAKLSYDLYFVRHRSAGLTMLILFATVWVVLFQKGAR